MYNPAGRCPVARRPIGCGNVDSPLIRTISLLLLFLAAACRTPPPQTETAPGSGGAAATSSPPIAVATRTPRPATSLEWWTVPSLSPATEAESPSPLDLALDGFLAERSGTDLLTEVKPERGAGGVAELLVATARVAPAALPDVVVLPLDALGDPEIVALLRPIDTTTATVRLEDAFAFAASSVRGGADEPALALPLAVDLVHAVARDAEPPATWDDLPAAAPFLVRGAAPDCSSLSPFLAWYAASGGSLVGLPDADPAAFEQALGFVREAAGSGALAVARTDGETRNPVWSAFLERGAPAAAVGAGTFARQQPGFPALAWGPLPGPNRPAAPVGCGWALAVTATESERAAEATALIEWLTAPDRHGWVVGGGHLPAYRSEWSRVVADAYEVPPEPAYLAYLEAQLAAALRAVGAADWAQEWAAAYARALEGEAAAPPSATP